jgi:hypothetical protein
VDERTIRYSQGVLSMIVILSNKPDKPGVIFELGTRSNKCVKIVGTSRSPIPNESAEPRMKRSRRV